mgnify:CR=1 FL=1
MGAVFRSYVKRFRMHRGVAGWLPGVTVPDSIMERMAKFEKKEDQLKSDFVSMVAHEIKSPLNSVLMQLNVVLDGLAGGLAKNKKKFSPEVLLKSSL